MVTLHFTALVLEYLLTNIHVLPPIQVHFLRHRRRMGTNAAGDIAERCLNGRSRRQWRRVLERSLFLKGVDGSAEHTKWSPDSSMEKNAIVRIVTAVIGIIGKKGAVKDGQVRTYSLTVFSLSRTGQVGTYTPTEYSIQ